jgi:glycosyltransferase involved in cell wall biosynthesis
MTAAQRNPATPHAAAAASKTVMLVGSFAPSLVAFRGPFIEAMAKRGHAVVAVAPDIDDSTAATLGKLGAHPLPLAIANQSINPLGLYRSIMELRRHLRAIRPDVLISYTIKPVIAGAMAGRAEGVPRIVSLITGAGYAFTGGLEPKRLISRAAAIALYRLALRKSDVVVFQNPDDEGLFRHLHLIGNRQNVARIAGSGIDLAYFAPTPLPERPAFLMIARLLKDKGVREYVEAACRLKQEYPQVAVRLVGYLDSSPDSVSQADLEAFRNGGGEFLGRLSDVRPALAEASVYVLPSYRVGTPRSVLEAMAMGRAIITTDAPGCRETVEEAVNGFLVPPRDADALYRAMTRFVRNRQLAATMGRESRKLAELKFDVERVNSDLIGLAGL